MITTRVFKVTSRGFTLVETLVAVTVLLMVIIGPMTIASRSMQNAYFAGDQTTAIYLAQEAIEHVQRLRDDAALSNYEDYVTDGSDGDGNTRSWYGALPGNCKDNDGCDVYLDASPVTYRDCSNATNCRLNKYTGGSPGVRIYGYNSGSGWNTSIYERRIKVGNFSNGGVPVTVTVSWSSSLFGSTRTITLQTYLYDTYSRFE